jgi:hypothetical protein
MGTPARIAPLLAALLIVPGIIMVLPVAISGHSPFRARGMLRGASASRSERTRAQGSLLLCRGVLVMSLALLFSVTEPVSLILTRISIALDIAGVAVVLRARTQQP